MNKTTKGSNGVLNERSQCKHLDKWLSVGQVYLQLTSQPPVGLLLTTLFCSLCGHVRVTHTMVELPKPSPIAIPSVNLKS